MRTGVLYLLPTPLGDLEVAGVLPDAVLARAASLDYFIAENAKSARAFLKAVGRVHALARPLQDISIAILDVDTPAAHMAALLEPLLAGRDGAVISEAGCPAIADPGALLVRAAHARGVTVKPLVGPSSILLALMASGLDGQRFAFHGYLPVEKDARVAQVRRLEQQSRSLRQTQLMIETPYRNDGVLDALLGALSANTRLCVATDVTLASESIVTAEVAHWRAEPRPVLKGRPSLFLFLAA